MGWCSAEHFCLSTRTASTGLFEARGARCLLVGHRLRIVPCHVSLSSQARIPVFSGPFICIPENSRGSRGFIKPPAGRFAQGRGGPTRRRGWVPAAGIQGPVPCRGFWQQSRIPLHFFCFSPRRSLRYTGGSFLVFSSRFTYKISPSKRIAAMHLPTSPAWFRDSSNSFGYISCLLLSLLLFLSWVLHLFLLLWFIESWVYGYGFTA